MTMTRTVRTGALSVVAALAALLLSGCFTLEMSLGIQADDTVDGSMVLAVDKSLADLMGGEDAMVDALSSEGSPFDEDPTEGSVEQREYRTDDKVGVEYVFDGIPIEEFSSDASGTGDDLTIVRDGDRYVVSGSMDLTNDEPGSDGGDPTQMLGDAEVRIAVTFPGDVVSADGDVDGRTVTWEPQVGAVTPINAVGSADAGLDLGLILGLALAALLLVVAVVAFLLLRGRRARPAAPGPLPPGSIVPEGLPQGGPTSSVAEPAGPTSGEQPTRATQVIPTAEQPTQVVELAEPTGEAPEPPR